MITLRPDQDQFVTDLRGALRQHQAVVGVAPCGFGKTVVAAFIARSVMAKGRRVVFGVHRKDLITQTAKTFAKFGIPCGFMVAGMPLDLGRQVYIASINTLVNRLDRLPADVLVADEAHLSCSAGWSTAIDHYKAKGSHVIGLTASPMRLDGQGLDRHYSAMVMGPSVRWLMEQGHLSTYRLFAPSTPDLGAVHSRAGDFATGELAAAMDKPSITGDAVSHYRRLAYGKRAVAFCVSIDHSKHVAEQFRQAGIMAVHVDGETPDVDKKIAIQGLADGKIQVLTNCQLFCEGFDMSSQVDRDVPIEAVILLRPTQSLALFIQQVGRGLRRKPEPGIILDHSGNCHRHGLPDDDREWSLAGKGKTAAGEKSAVPVRTCEKCFAAMPAAVDRCPHCGFVFLAKPREVEQVEGELKEIDLERERLEKRKAALTEQAKAQTLDDLIAIGKSRGYKSEKWAQQVYAHRQRKAAARYIERTQGVVLNQ